jgi:GDP-L-fucose synthase
LNIFVAGHTGMVGSSILRLAPQGHEVVTATRTEIDLTSAHEVTTFLQSNAIDVVIVAAAKVGGIGANSKYQKAFLVENLNLQNGILMGAADAGTKRLIFLGSSCIYPKLAPQPINETSLLTGVLESTNDGYALAKIAGVRLCKAIYDEQSLRYFSLMPANLYGPNDNYDKFDSHVPAALMRKFHEAKVNNEPEVVVWGTGKPRREFMHVDDIARACWYMLDQEVGGELINIGTGIDVTIAEFADLMAKVVGYGGKIIYDSSMPDGTPRKLLDVRKAHSYGWKHQIELEDGLCQTYAWFVDALGKGEVRGY